MQKIILLVTFILFTVVFAKNKDDVKSIAISYDKKSAVPLSSLGNSRTFDIIVPAGTTAYIDKNVNVGSITVHGELHCDEQRALDHVQVTTDFLFIEDGGVFQCGTRTSPYLKKLVISLRDNRDYDPRTNPRYRGLMARPGAQLLLHGNTSQSGFVKLSHTAEPGTRIIHIDGGPTTVDPHHQLTIAKRAGRYDTFNQFRVGDKIAIGPTGYNYEEAESATIVHIDPRNPGVLHLDRNLTYRHWGQKQSFASANNGQVTIDERAEVANLTRSIVIQGDGAIGQGIGEWDQRGGHVMIMPNAFAQISGVEFY